nr:transporter [Stenotrophomonas ginsengisoli]
MTGQDEAGNEDQVQALVAQLEALKASYAQEVRRLRELDMQVQALQSRLGGRAAALPATSAAAPAAVPAAAPPAPASAANGAELASQAGTAAEAEQARSQSLRSVDDVKQQQAALFNRRLSVEAGLAYTRYDRKQLTLNGFLALDAIFLGNIGIENVESDTATLSLATRWGVTPRLTLSAEVPWIERKTVYQKGGAGGSAAAIAQQTSSGGGLGDASVSANFKLLSERARWPETVLTAGITAPTGREPYGVDWRVIERDDDDFIRFAVPGEQPTGNGVWQANLGVSMVKTADPAILFANFGYIYSQQGSFDDLDSNPDTVNPGDVKLGNVFYAGAGLAFAFNERTSLSLSYSGRFSARARTRYRGGEWTKVIGSDGNAGTLNLGMTYAINRHATVVTQLGVGLSPDAPDFSLSFKLPYAF